ncbi:MAG: hypothetical protein HUU10_07980 [Bacteroidetes bacterium]|nr:hypothetical protein [Bacteroidota bacterium]
MTAFSFSCLPDSLGQHYPFVHYNQDHGLPGSPVTAFLRDSRQYMWVANYNGLSITDGFRFRVLTTTDGLIANSIRCLEEDNHGQIWIGTDSGISIFDGFRFKNYPSGEQIGAGIVWEISRAQDGSMWIATSEGGLTVFDGTQFIRHSLPGGLSDQSVLSVLPLTKDTLLVGTRNHGVKKLAVARDGTVHDITTPDLTAIGKQHLIKKIRRDPTGNIWVATRGGGVFFKRNQSGRFNSAPILAGHDVYDLAFLSDRLVSCAIFGDGIILLRFDDDFNLVTEEKWSVDNGLANEKPWSLYVDPDSILYIGHLTGFSKLTTRQIRHFSIPGFENEKTIFSLSPDSSGVWAVTNKVVTHISLTEGTRNFKSYSESAGVPATEKLVIYTDPTGRTLLGSSRGIHLFKYPRFHAVEGLPAANVIDLVATPDLTYWAATGQGLWTFRLDRTGKASYFEEYRLNAGVSSNTFYSVAPGPDGRIWTCSPSSGISFLKNGRLSNLSKKDGLPDQSIWDLTVSKNGTIWAVSNSVGLIRIIPDGDSFQYSVFSVKDGLSSGFCTSVQFGPDSSLIVGHNTGLDILRFQAPDDPTRFNGRVVRRLNRQNGLGGNEVTTGSSIILDFLQRLWIGLVDGLTVADWQILQTPLAPFRPVITRIFSHSEPVYHERFFHPDTLTESGVPVQLPPGTSNLRFEFTALNFRAPEATVFSYRLSGLDETWSPLSHSREKEYTNLSPGTYQFELRAKHPDGDWGETVHSVPVIILPFFWQTWWFITLSALFFSGGLTGWIFLRVGRIEKQKQMLEAEVGKRTNDLERYAQEVESANQALFDLSRQKSQLLSIAAHDLRNPLTAITTTAEMIIARSDQPESVIQRAEFIRSASIRMVQTINSLLDLTAIEDGKMELTKSEFNLPDVLRFVTEANHIMAEKKQISVRLHLPAGSRLPVFADEAKIQLVLENLLSNAIKFSPSGSMVELGLNRVETGYQIWIRDEGPGFSEDDQKRLFGRFEKLSARPTAGEHSSGLGLSISAELIRMHNGIITLESKPGEGACFTISLPFGKQFF